jgi:hypothetical protein
MKTLLTGSLLLLSVCAAKAQDENPCDNSLIHNQVDSLKNIFLRSGFMIIQEANVAMESESELPVIVPMKMGANYQVVFIGDVHSQSYEVRMFDFNEKQVFYRKSNYADHKENIITYSYTPQMSEYHMIRPVQVNNKQKKNLCGYFILLKKNPGQKK